MVVSGSPLRRSPEREVTFLGILTVWVAAAVPIGIKPVFLLGGGLLLTTGYFTLRLIQAVERLAAATEQLATESDELSDSVQSWPWS